MSRTETLKELWRRGQRGWPADFPLVQAPNAPLLVAAGGWAVAALTDGPAHAPARAVFHAGLGAWAWMELAGGANWVRRLAGAAVLVVVAVRVASAVRG